MKHCGRPTYCVLLCRRKTWKMALKGLTSLATIDIKVLFFFPHFCEDSVVLANEYLMTFYVESGFF